MEWKSKRKIYTLSNWILLYFVCIVLYCIVSNWMRLNWIDYSCLNCHYSAEFECWTFHLDDNKLDLKKLAILFRQNWELNEKSGKNDSWIYLYYFQHPIHNLFIHKQFRRQLPLRLSIVNLYIGSLLVRSLKTQIIRTQCRLVGW